jgi:hypothetical protein
VRISIEWQSPAANQIAPEFVSNFINIKKPEEFGYGGTA